MIPFFRIGYYHKEYKEIDRLGSGSFGTVFKVIDKAQNYYAIKIKPNPKYDKEFMEEFINYSVIGSFGRKLIVSHFDAWFENYDHKTDRKIYLYIVMESCDKPLEDIIDQLNSDPIFKRDESLTPIGYYIASQLFIEILNGVLLLHQKNLIHKDLCPSNILVKKDEKKIHQNK
jgi:serine/threonine protein kinase